MNNVSTLFICRANVGRSQIAEGIYRSNRLGHVMSLAGAEARKEKYDGKPLPAITYFLKQSFGIDISGQEILYISDLSKNQLDSFDRVIFLYDPRIETDCDEECCINEISPYEYFLTTSVRIYISPVEDPFDVGLGGYLSLTQKIEKIIFSL